MALTAQAPEPLSWNGRWLPQQSNGGYMMVDSSGSLMSYESSPTTAAPVQRPAMSSQFMVGNTYTAAPSTSSQMSHYPTENNSFVYAPFTPQTSPTLSGSFKQYQEDYPPARSMATNTESIHASYQRGAGQTHQDEQDTSSEIKYEPTVMSERSTTSSPAPPPVPVAFKTIHRNVAENKDNEIEFTTNVDILMKAIQFNDVKEEDDFAEAAYPSPSSVDEEKFSQRVKPVSSEETTSKTQSKRDRQRRYVCDIPGCEKRCSQKTQLETHKRAHTGERPYSCPEPGCHRRFTQRGNLKTHIRSHTGERPYSCDLCGQTFAQRGNVKPHRITHFKSKPFPCSLDGCQKTFGTRGNLKTHHNKFHSETLRDLTMRFSALPPGARLSEEDQKLFSYFAKLYKNSNKGIKGRGKDQRSAPKQKSSTAPSTSQHYSVQPQLNIYPHSRSFPQQSLPCPDEYGAYGTARQHMPSSYSMYDMDQSSVSSSDMSTASSSPVTIYEEEHGRTMLPQHRMY